MAAATVLSDKGLWWMVRTWLFMAILALLIDWTFVFLVWTDGVDELKKMLATELAYTYSVGGLSSSATGFAMEVANALYSLAFKATGIHDLMLRFADPTPLNAVDSTMRDLYWQGRDWIRTAMVGIQLFGVRLAILMQAVPLFALAFMVAFSDGWWAGRFIRRASGGRESSFMYHRAKHFIFISLTGAWAYLLLPFSIDPRWAIPPFALFFAGAVRGWAAYFKKYL